MERTIIKNGIVFDPLNDIDGEVKDILIENRKIVERFSSENDVKEINAKNKTVIPSAIDIHAHVASQQVNWARLLGSKNPKFQESWKGLTLESVAKDYVSNGYTFIIEANVFPSLSKQTMFNFLQLPMLDKAMLLNVSNLSALELEYKRGKTEEMAIFLSDLLSKTKSFGFKAYNPFESEDWDFKSLRSDLSSNGRLYYFSALDVYENLAKCNEYLDLPHSLHAHVEGYENKQGKDNLFTILNLIKSLNLKENSGKTRKFGRAQLFHLAHASSYNIDGVNKELIDFLNNNKDFDLDLGCLGFNDINPLITSDRRLIYSLLSESDANNKKDLKVIRSAIEFEGDSFATLRSLSKNNEKDCIMWSNAIELALGVKNKFQIQLSVNYPNYASINDIPEIALLLMSSEVREKFMKDMNPNFLNTSSLKNNEDCLSFNEFIIISRASPAKSLGLGNIKGNLGIGSDGDINILDLNTNEIDVSKDYEIVINALKNIDHVMKGGVIIKKQDKIDLKNRGKIFWSKGKGIEKDKSYVISKKKEFYQKYGSIFYDSFNNDIDASYLREI